MLHILVTAVCVCRFAIHNDKTPLALWREDNKQQTANRHTPSSMLPSVSVVLTGDGGSAFGSALSERLQSMGGRGSEIRSSKVVESWDGLTDVSNLKDVSCNQPLLSMYE